MSIPTAVDDESMPSAARRRLWHREARTLLVVFAVALVPLWFLVKSNREPRPTGGLNPNSPWRLGDNRWRTAQIQLSPSGRFLAAVCPMVSATPLPSAVADQSSDLVVWRVRDGAQMARAPLGLEAPGSIRWARDETSVATVGLGEVHLFAWRAGTLMGTPQPPAPSSMNSVIANWVDLDGDLQIRGDLGNNLQAWQISTGNSLALAPQIGRKINNQGLEDSDAAFALQPTTPGGPIRVAVLADEPLPIRTPRPTPTPLPTPTPSVAQSAFLKEEQKMGEEVSQLMDTLQAEEAPSEEESARIEERVKAINARILSERARLFAAPPAVPTPTPMPPRWARLTLWDLKSGRSLWQKRLRSGSSPLKLSWSPDAKFLVVLGTPRPPKSRGNRNPDQRGIEFLQGASGKSLGSNALDEDLGWFSTRNVLWLSGARLVLKDLDEKRQPLLRSYNAANGQAGRSWKLPNVVRTLGNSLDSMTTDSTGALWAFANGGQGWRVFTQSEL